MIKVGAYNTLKVLRIVDFGCYLDDGAEGILLPKRFAPNGVNIDDELKVFIYHDGEDRLIATTQTPKGTVGDIVKLRCISITPHGAFLDNGLMKDVFVPISKQQTSMMPNGEYMVKIFIDENSGRMAATEWFEKELNNETLTVKVLDEVNLTVYRRTDIGFVVIINNRHTGVLHNNEIYRNIAIGDRFTGFIKTIYPDTNKIDVAAGKQGYQRVDAEGEKILSMLKKANGYLPFTDKTNPEEIYAAFGMSKKTFKMVIGNLYKQRLINFEEKGIRTN